MHRVLPDLSEWDEDDLLALYAHVMAALVRTGVVSTGNAPVGEYAEVLAQRALNGTRQGFSNKGFDLLCPAYGRVQVKAATRPASGGVTFSPVRSIGDPDSFDHVLLVVLDRSTYRVAEAVLLTRGSVIAASRHSAHVNGLRLSLSRARKDPRRIDVTTLLRRAQTDFLPWVLGEARPPTSVADARED